MKKIRIRNYSMRFVATVIIAGTFVLPTNFQAHAQTTLNLNNILPNRALDTAMPNAAERQGMTVDMTEQEVQAFLARPRNWFHSLGSGGSPFTKPVTLDPFAKVLSDMDEDLYRLTFELIEKRKFVEARATLAQIQDQVLAGHVEAAILLGTSRPALSDMQAWLARYADLPEADDIYERAQKVKPKGVELNKPDKDRRFSGNVERADGGGTTEWDMEGLSANLSPALRASLTRMLDKKPNTEEVEAWLAAQNKDDLRNPVVDAGLRLTAAEFLMRRGGKAWPLVKDTDPAKGKLDNSALAYALWVKGLNAWISQAYVNAYTSFKAVTDVKDLPGQNRAAAAFWAARAALKINRKAAADHMMAMASKQSRSFYGVLALSHRDAAPQYNWNMPAFDAGKAQALKKEPEGKRALALLQLDERVLAEAELRDLSLHQRRELVNSVLALANRYRLPALAMQIGSAITRERMYDAALYPLMPWQPVGGYSSDPALVLAVAKNESHFNHTARSPKGAGGLMQVMPRTADYVKPGSSRNLYDPEVNVTLGDRYLDLLTRTQGVKDNLLLIIGAYNCGPDTLVKLRDAALKQNGDDALLFVETLPIKETRNYIQKVLATYWVYRARFNRPLKSMAELAIGRWPSYRPHDMKLTDAAGSSY